MLTYINLTKVLLHEKLNDSYRITMNNVSSEKIESKKK